VEAAVGEIDNAHDSEDQREAAGDQEQQQPVLNAVEQLNQKRVDVHPTTPRRGKRARAENGCPRGSRQRQSLQPRAGSATALTATPTTLFSLPSTLRRYMSCTGLCALDSVIAPRGLSILVDSIAATSSLRLEISPLTAVRPALSNCAASYPPTA